MTYDRRTGKPIASAVLKIASEAFLASDDQGAGDGQPGAQAEGFITTEPLLGKDGRVAYENRGECFFLPFTIDDIEPGNILRSNDRVSFKIATDKSGNLRARKLTPLVRTPERYQGVVCTLKDSFGFIERADIVREIFFHSSEAMDFKSLNLGDDVEFGIQTRNDKKVAVNVIPLPPGTVVFEDVSAEKFTGIVIRPAEKAPHGFGRQQYSGPVGGSAGAGVESGIIRFLGLNESDICFAAKDINGEFTMKENDLVTFNVVTDKRDNMKHAGKVTLHEDCFVKTGEARENGYIASLKDAYGFIKCFNRDGTRVYFKLAELLDPNYPVNINDEVEFTLSQDFSSPGRLQAIRIKFLPNGTIMSNLLNPKNSRPSLLDYPLIDLGGDDSVSGMRRENGNSYSPAGNAVRTDTWSDILSQLPIKIEAGYTNGAGSNHVDLLTSGSLDDPTFGILNDVSSSRGFDLPQQVVRKADREEVTRNGSSRSHGRGFVAALKESFGFIENEEHQSEVFFHFTVFDGDSNELELGQEVEYFFTVKNGKMSAEAVKRLPSKTIPREDVTSDVVSGVVIRSCRCLNPDQEYYPGLIRITSQSGENPDENEEQILEFSMTSLWDIRDFVQKNDAVSLQIGIDRITGRERAVNVKPIRNKVKATVDTIKSNFGFLNYEVGDEGKKLFFHMSEFKGRELNPGDTVEFAVVHNHRTNKYSACNLTKSSS
jgi:cold shock CspA family protein